MTNRIVFFQTPRTDLVQLTVADAATSVTWFNDGAITRYLARHDWPMAQADAEQYYTEAYSKRDKLILGIHDRESATLIGTTGLHSINRTDQTAVFGIVIGNPDFHNKKIGREVLEAMCLIAFTRLNLRAVSLMVLGNNPRGVRCYQSCGFMEVGRLPAHIFRDGEYVDEIIMLRKRQPSS